MSATFGWEARLWPEPAWDDLTRMVVFQRRGDTYHFLTPPTPEGTQSIKVVDDGEPTPDEVVWKFSRGVGRAIHLAMLEHFGDPATDRAQLLGELKATVEALRVERARVDHRLGITYPDRIMVTGKGVGS